MTWYIRLWVNVGYMTLQSTLTSKPFWHTLSSKCASSYRICRSHVKHMYIAAAFNSFGYNCCQIRLLACIKKTRYNFLFQITSYRFLIQRSRYTSCSYEFRLESDFLLEHSVLKWDNLWVLWDLLPATVDLRAAHYPQLGQREREVQHVWTTPDMTGRLTVSIRANENWEKTDSVVLQIGASGVKLQEYANYLNWSLRRLPW